MAFEFTENFTVQLPDMSESKYDFSESFTKFFDVEKNTLKEEKNI